MSIKVIATVERIRFYKNQWGIIVCSIDKINKGELRTDKENTVFKGEMSQPKIGNSYLITASHVVDTKWGDQYQIEAMCTLLSLEDMDGKKKFLSALFTPIQVEEMYNALSDPFDVLDKEDVASLVKVKGCGIKTANLWIYKFKKHIGAAKIYIELDEYELTNKIITKLLNRYISPDVVIEKVKHNPYVLCNEVDGIGWKKADEIALKGGIDPYGEVRIAAYIQYYLSLCGEEGCSWITPDQLLGAVLDNVGEEVPDANITKAIQNLGDIIWHDDEKTKIGLKRYFNIENNVAIELLRIRNAESKIKCEDWEYRIEALEKEQGWNFTNEQISAVELALNNNVILITGLAGTGKTSTVNAILAVLNKYPHSMCALSGRASARLAEITGEEGFTIHRLLEYPHGDALYQKFYYNQDNQLECGIYIVDEISMVDARLFNYLLRAIPNGSKVICLGDQGQLESIGSGNIAHDMISSSEIPSIELTKIHRQAAKSGIITESIKVRNGTQIVSKNWAGRIVYGELQDLEIVGFSDSSNTFFEIMKAFSNIQSKKDFDIMETQIIVPVKTKGTACTYNINNTIQELCNPPSKKKIERTQFSNGRPYILREGDKVMNMVNNYNTSSPIFNGNIGILKSFITKEDDEEFMVIDFRGIGTIEVPREHWNCIELGYACTCHKSQGDQMDYVILGIDFSGYSLLTRELVYTGITRAKKKCYIVTQTGALRYATMQHAVSNKQTHLQQCLYDIAHPKLIF